MRLLSALAASLLPVGLASAQGSGNILLLVADDVGVHELGLYGTGTDAAITPTLDGLAAGGVTFQSCWSNPYCAPTRATLLTGRYSAHTGIGTLVTTGWSIQPEEVTVAELLHAAPTPYVNAFFGKWHLSSVADGDLAPNEQGFDHAIWTRFNLNPPQDTYFRWEQIEDGAVHLRIGYITSHVVDRALEFLATAPEPWFVQVSFHAAHSPFHKPLTGLYSTDLSGVTPGDKRPLYKAMIEAMDTEIGRLLQGIEQLNTTADVIFLGDNGSPGPVIGPPGEAGKAKGSLFEGGVRVPLIVAGPSVAAAGASCDAILNTTDVFASILELAGAPVTPELADELELDSVSFVPFLGDPDAPQLRKFTFAEYFTPTGFEPDVYWGAVRGRRYKLIVSLPSLAVTMFDLVTDPTEGLNLLGAPLSPSVQAAYADLLEALVAHTLSFGGL